MSDIVQIIKKKINSCSTLNSIVKTLKVLSAANRLVYQKMTKALDQYDKSVELGFIATLLESSKYIDTFEIKKRNVQKTGVILIGSDLGLVGQFNEVLLQFALNTLKADAAPKIIWTVGERLHFHLKEHQEFELKPFYHIPATAAHILSLLISLQSSLEQEIETLDQLLVFFNRSKGLSNYEPTFIRLLPLDKQWLHQFSQKKWPSRKIPEVIDGIETTFFTLIKEYLFIEIYRACAESLNSENSARFMYMKMAQQNIEDLSEQLKQELNHARQALIDRELADVLSGFEALRANPFFH